MLKLGKTWWGQRFIDALQGFTDRGRLERGRSYRGDSRILAFDVTDGLVTATVRGNINPYFGVHKEPRYKTKIQMVQFAGEAWDNAVRYLGRNAALVSKLLMDEMPDNIDDAFADVDLRLLPHSRQDFALTHCSCPDHVSPCKHIAGVYYRLASQLDSDPFLLFELRGLSRERLLQTVAKTPLGKALATLAAESTIDLTAAESLYTRPAAASSVMPDYHAFWHGKRRLPRELEPVTPSTVSGILIRKGGHYPAFWEKDVSFIEIMEELTERVRAKN